MIGLAGVANNGMLYVQQLLSEFSRANDTKYKVQVLGFEDAVRKKMDFILVPTVHQLVKHARDLNKSKAVVIVFDTPMLLEYIHPITLLDVGERKLSYLYTFKSMHYDAFASAITNLLGNKNRITIERTQFDVIPTMLGSQLSTILNPIQTYLYGVRNTDHRLRYQQLIYTWLVSGADVKVLEARLLKTTEDKKKTVGMVRLLETLAQDQFTTMRQAFKDAFEGKVAPEGKKKKAVNYKSLSKKYGVDPFDIRYTMKALRRFGTFQVIGRDVKEIYKEHVAASKTRRAAQEEAEV